MMKFTKIEKSKNVPSVVPRDVLSVTLRTSNHKLFGCSKCCAIFIWKTLDVLSVCRPIYIHLGSSIFTYISVNLSINQSIYLSILHVSFFFSFFLSFLLSFYVSIDVSMHLSIYVSVYLSVCLIISESETPIKPTSNLQCILHGTSIKRQSARHMREPASVDTGAFKTSMKPPWNLHGTSIKPASVRIGLHDSTNKCRYKGLSNLHETYIKPPCILHGTSIKPASVRLGLHDRTNKCRYRGL